MKHPGLKQMFEKTAIKFHENLMANIVFFQELLDLQSQVLNCSSDCNNWYQSLFIQEAVHRGVQGK